MDIQYQFVPYLWLSLLLIIMMLALIRYAWKNRAVCGVRYLLFTLLLITVWIVAQALEIAAIDLSAKVVWANIQYIPITLAPVTYFFLVAQFTRRDRWLRLRWLPILLLIVPVALNLLLWNNDFHSLIRQNVHLDQNGAFSTLGKTYGPLFWGFAVYNFALSIFTLLIIAKELRDKTPLYQEQAIAVFMGLLLPVCSTALQVTGINPFRIDMTPVVFGLSGVIISWGIFRYHLFDIVPIAHSIIIQEMSTGMVIFDNEGRVLDINPAAQKMLYITLHQPVGLSIEVILDGYPNLIQLFRNKESGSDEVAVWNNGTYNYYEVSMKQLTDADSKVIGWIMQGYDITKRKIQEERMRYAASHDDLTGLPNRSYFQNIFKEQLAHAMMSKTSFAVAYLDLDNFKQINDAHGHEAGDIVLQGVASRLKRTLRHSDIIARVGGDEYAIIFPAIGENDKLEIIGRKILQAFKDGIWVNDIALEVKVSIGFSVFPRDGDSIESLVMKADKAMYEVKDKTKNYYSIYRE